MICPTCGNARNFDCRDKFHDESHDAKRATQPIAAKPNERLLQEELTDAHNRVSSTPQPVPKLSFWCHIHGITGSTPCRCFYDRGDIRDKDGRTITWGEILAREGNR